MKQPSPPGEGGNDGEKAASYEAGGGAMKIIEQLGDFSSV